MSNLHDDVENDKLIIKSEEEIPEKTLLKQFTENLIKFSFLAIYEFIAIFFFAFCICFTLGNIDHFIFGFWVVLAVFGSYSGAHTNPAVTLSFYIYDGDWIWGLVKLVLFWFAQWLGAGLASKICYWLLSISVYVSVPSTSSYFEVFWSEFLFTGTFCFIFLFMCSKITSPTNTNWSIKCIVICAWFYVVSQMGSSLSGSSFNPAILLTLNGWSYFQGNQEGLNLMGLMIIAQLIGAALFSVLFKYVAERLYPRAKDIDEDISGHKEDEFYEEQAEEESEALDIYNPDQDKGNARADDKGSGKGDDKMKVVIVEGKAKGYGKCDKNEDDKDDKEGENSFHTKSSYDSDWDRNENPQDRNSVTEKLGLFKEPK